MNFVQILAETVPSPLVAACVNTMLGGPEDSRFGTRAHELWHTGPPIARSFLHEYGSTGVVGLYEVEGSLTCQGLACNTCQHVKVNVVNGDPNAPFNHRKVGGGERGSYWSSAASLEAAQNNWSGGKYVGTGH